MGPLRSLYEILKQDLSYNESGKEEFRQKAVTYLERLARQLELTKYEVHFEPGGVAVPGDATLRGMWAAENGIHVQITEVMGEPTFMYRSITSMRDYGGGPSHYIWFPNGSYEKTIFDEQEVCEKLLRLSHKHTTESHL